MPTTYVKETLAYAARRRGPELKRLTQAIQDRFYTPDGHSIDTSVDTQGDETPIHSAECPVYRAIQVIDEKFKDHELHGDPTLAEIQDDVTDLTLLMKRPGVPKINMRRYERHCQYFEDELLKRSA